jgi:hypothetical protein
VLLLTFRAVSNYRGPTQSIRRKPDTCSVLKAGISINKIVPIPSFQHKYSLHCITMVVAGLRRRRAALG